MWQHFQATRHDACGKWDWEAEDLDGYTLEYDVCPFCVEIEGRDVEVRQKRASMTGVTWVYVPPQVEGVADGH